MADLNIQKKEGPNIWPWILGALALIALVWVLIEATDGDDRIDEQIIADTTAELTTPVAPSAVEADVSGPVDEFVRFVRERPAEEGLGHSYTAGGIRRLSDALSAMVDRDDVGDVNMSAKRDTLRQRAARLEANPQSLEHSQVAHDAFTSAADLMAEMQAKRYPGLSNQVTGVREAAQGINPNGLLSNQTNEVQTFFERASASLQAMAQTTG